MKKKFLRVALVVAVVAVAGYGVCQTQQEDPMSEVMLANVEALASDESSSGRYQTMGYCTPFRLDFKCQYTPTSTSCTRDC